LQNNALNFTIPKTHPSFQQGFYIFDFCDNFDFFDINPKGKITGGSFNLSQKIFELKLDMIIELQKSEHQQNEEDISDLQHIFGKVEH